MSLKRMIADGDRTLPFDEVWKACRARERSKLLRNLLAGEIAAEGIYMSLPYDNEMGEFRVIDRISWLYTTEKQIRSFHRKKLPFSLHTDEDGAGYVQIVLFSNLALLELLPFELSGIEITPKMADEALAFARNQMIGHQVTCEAYFALCSGLVPAKAAKLAYHLEDLEGLWSNGKPQSETLLKFCGIAVNTYKNRARNLSES